MSEEIYINIGVWIALTRYSVVNTIILTSIIMLFLIFITKKIKFLPKTNIVFTYLSVSIIGIRLMLFAPSDM